jgi:hypothetical protein
MAQYFQQRDEDEREMEVFVWFRFWGGRETEEEFKSTAKANDDLTREVGINAAELWEKIMRQYGAVE